MSHVSALAIVVSKSFARRRLRLSEAMDRSTTQRRGNNLKPLAASFDDHDGPATDRGQCLAEFRTGIAAVGENMTQPWEGASDLLEKRRASVAVLYAGFMHNACDQKLLSDGFSRLQSC